MQVLHILRPKNGSTCRLGFNFPFSVAETWNRTLARLAVSFTSVLSNGERCLRVQAKATFKKCLPSDPGIRNCTHAFVLMLLCSLPQNCQTAPQAGVCSRSHQVSACACVRAFSFGNAGNPRCHLKRATIRSLLASSLRPGWCTHALAKDNSLPTAAGVGLYTNTAAATQWSSMRTTKTTTNRVRQQLLWRGALLHENRVKNSCLHCTASRRERRQRIQAVQKARRESSTTSRIT